MREEHACCLCDPTVHDEYTAMVKTGNECLLGNACRHTVNFAVKVCCARTRFEAKFPFRLVLNTLLAESETYNALVVMVCSGERSTWSTERITERDTAQTERILTRLVITVRPDSGSVSSHDNSNNIASHPYIASIPSCVVEPRLARTLSVVLEPALRPRTLKLSGGDQVLRAPALIRDHPDRGEEQGNLQRRIIRIFFNST